MQLLSFLASPGGQSRALVPVWVSAELPIAPVPLVVPLLVVPLLVVPGVPR